MNLKQRRKTVYVTLCLLLICAILLGTASYAWITIATAPDVMGINTNIGANGSLEIALLNQETYVDPSLITSKIGGSLEANNPLLANVQWGNVLDLSDPSYGLGNITLIPSRLDVSPGLVVSNNLLTVPSYSEDGRFNQFNTSMGSGVYIEGAAGKSSFIFDPQNPGYGIRGIGTITGISAQEAALVYSRTAVKSYSASAEAAIIRFWETHGEDFFYIVHHEGFFTKWEETEKAVETFYLMATDMLEILDLFDSALRQGMIGYLSSAIESEKEFNAIKEIIENKSIPLSSLFDYIPVSIPTLYTSCIGSLETDIRQMERIRGQYISYINGVISLSQINMSTTMQGFLDTHKSYINGEIVFYLDSEFPLTEDNELTVLTHTPGYIDPYGEVLHSIPLYIGDYNAFFNYDGKSFEVVTLTKSDESPILESISLALDALVTNEDDPMQAVNLNEVYGFVMDMAFRCNEDSNLLLQTAEDFRVDGGSELIDFQGGGSYMRFTSEQMSNQQIVLMMDAIRVGFLDNQNNLLGIAKLNTSNFAATNVGVTVPLCMYDFTVLESGAIKTGQRLDDGAVITGLNRGQPVVLSVVVWLDGDYVDNSLAAIRDQSMVGVLNLQFASSADLNPAVPGNPADPNATKPTEPDATVPTQPDVTEPTEPTEPSRPDGTEIEGVYYLGEGENDSLAFYTVYEDGTRAYEMLFKGQINDENQTVVVSKLIRGSGLDVIIPGLVVNTANDSLYRVSISPDSPFDDFYATNGHIRFQEIDSYKVGITDSDLSDLFNEDSAGYFTSIDLSGLDTSTATDMSYMFAYCDRLTELDLSCLDTSNVTNMHSMFSQCYNLGTLNLSGLDTSKVTDMGGMFYYCDNLTALDLSDWDVSAVTNLRYMFEDCRILKNLNISGWDTSSVTDMSGMFYRCYALDSLDVADWDTSNVTDMSYMFWVCGFEEIDVSEWDVSAVTDMKYMFAASEVTALDISGWNTSNVTNMEHMFSKSDLVELDLSNWNVSSVTNMNNLFSECSYLTSVNVGDWDISSVTDMSYMFASCSKLIDVDCSGWNKASVTDMSNMFYDCANLTKLDASGWDTSHVLNMEKMFSKCSSLSELDTNGWDTSNVTNMREMFYYCQALTEFDPSGWDVSSVTDMGGMFRYCILLETLNVSGWNTQNVVNMNGMFNLCKSLVTLELNSWNTSSAKDLGAMFMNCTNLTALSISNWDLSNATSVYSMFSGCSSLNELDVSDWDMSNVRSASAMFQSCKSLTELDVSRWNTGKITSFESMFNGCAGLTQLDLNSWNTESVTDMWGVFKDCTGLTDLKVSNWDTSHVTDMRAMFYNCVSLTALDISNWNIPYYSHDMFYNCPAGN